MITNIKLDETLTFFEMTKDAFGDEVTSGGTPVPASVDATYQWTSGGYQENNPSSLNAWIMPAFYAEKSGRLYGLIAKYTNELGISDERMYYKVTNVVPGKSMYSSEADLVELTLERIEKDV